MQPRPSADTVGPSRPSVRSFIGPLCTHAACWSDVAMDYGLAGQGRARDRCGVGHRTRDGGAVRCDGGAGGGVRRQRGRRARRWPRRLREARFVAADVTDGEALRGVVADAVQAFGRLDCAANCAGVGGGHASTHEYPEAEWDRIVEINLRGTWLSMRAEIEAMLEGRGRGDRQRLLDARPARIAVRGALQREQARRPRPHAERRRSSTRRRGSASTRCARARSTRR